MLVHGYLISWLVGGLGLLTMILLRTRRQPAALMLALIGFGGTGFVAQGLGLPSSLQSAMLGATILGVVGYALQPRTASVSPPHETPEP